MIYDQKKINTSFKTNAELTRHARAAGPAIKLPTNGKGYRFYLRQQAQRKEA